MVPLRTVQRWSLFPDATLIPYASIPACLKAIEQQEVTCSIIPIENTIEGTVNASIDYLYHQAQLPVQAELVLPIQQQLMVAKENQSIWQQSQKNFITSASISSIADVSSEKLSRSDFRINAFNSLRSQIHCRTSRITFLRLLHQKLSAEMYDLTIVEKNIQDLSVKSNPILGSWF